MLFGRFADESKVTDVVLPAFKEYLNEYVSLMSTAVPDHNEESKRIVMERQTSYDAYSALKDPAVGLFDAYFGKEWSASFVHDFLFSFSNKDSAVPVAAPVHNFKINMATGAVGPASGHSTH
jgi:Ferredoxin-dependent bilin reductase